MHTTRIAALLEPFLAGCPTPRGVRDVRLSSAQLDQISTYIDLLLRWNARINLTGIRNPDEIVTRHFGESFFMARHLFPLPPASEPAASVKQALSHEPRATTKRTVDSSSELEARNSKPSFRVLDLGSGAGFPGLPLRIWAPHIHLTLIESNHKKAAFLREVARALTLTDVGVLAERAETVAARVIFPSPQSASPNSDLAAAPVAGGFPSLPGQVPPTSFAVNASARVGANGSQRHLATDSSTARPTTRSSPARRAHFSPAAPPTAARSFLAADIVTFRAVEKFDQILPLATRFLAPNGRLALLISSAQVQRLRVISNDTKLTFVCIPGSHMRTLAISAKI